MQHADSIKSFIDTHFRHFNAKNVKLAAQAYHEQLKLGNKMMVTLAGAMSTAELGRSLAEMIRQDKIAAICCTGANLEEDVFKLVAHNSYKIIPDWRSLSAQDELDLFAQGYNRVTDTCIPEEEAMRKIEGVITKKWIDADQKGQSYFPHEYLYEILLSGELKEHYEAPIEDCWLMEAAKKNLPLFVPGWEDSTLGNIFVAAHIRGEIKSLNTMKSGVFYMKELASYYESVTKTSEIGFFQIGGGIAGDFPICVVPMLAQDLKKSTKLWSYFCQISDSTTSYGSYSGAVPNEKITWGKLDETSPKFIIESDATIVAPLIFAYILAS